MTSRTEHNSKNRSRSRRTGRITQTRRTTRTTRTRLWFAVAAVALLAVGCSTGPGSQEQLVGVLVDTGGLSETEATCIAEDVFDEYAADEEALKAISSAPNFEFLSGDEGVPGFSDFFDQTVQRCAAVGPTTG